MKGGREDVDTPFWSWDGGNKEEGDIVCKMACEDDAREDIVRFPFPQACQLGEPD